MLYIYIWLFPVLAGLLSWILKNKRLNKAIVLVHSALHLVGAIAVALPQTSLAAHFGIDSLSVWFVLVSALLYFAVGLYSLKTDDGLNARQSSIYAICMMAFVASMDGANLSRDFGLIWVFVETTTLATAMLISFEHHKQSLEAAWKYLFICSVGIAIAFVGVLLLVIAQISEPSLSYDAVLQSIAQVNPFWMKVSFVFMLIGFGTKLGLAPMHFWLPDAHSEAPAPVSALLSGALLNTALLPLLRMQGLMDAAGLGWIASQMFQVLGFISLFIAAMFIVKVKNFKRLLAYSSIENMGLIMIAFGLGGAASRIGLIHVMGHSLIKASFFLTAGNAYHIFAQKEYDKCGGLLDVHAPSGWLWLLSFMFIVGMPPSPLFFSEFGIAVQLLARANVAGVVIYFIFLASIAYGLGRASLAVTMGSSEKRAKLPVLQWLPQAGMLLLAMGVPYLLYLLIETVS